MIFKVSSFNVVACLKIILQHNASMSLIKNITKRKCQTKYVFFLLLLTYLEETMHFIKSFLSLTRVLLHFSLRVVLVFLGGKCVSVQIPDSFLCFDINLE